MDTLCIPHTVIVYEESGFKLLSVRALHAEDSVYYYPYICSEAFDRNILALVTHITVEQYLAKTHVFRVPIEELIVKK